MKLVIGFLAYLKTQFAENSNCLIWLLQYSCQLCENQC